jgi:hypothetical protein
VLGGPALDRAREASIATKKADADAHAARVLPIIQSIKAAGAKSDRAIAAELTARKVETARGGEWTGVQVANIIKRAGK